MGMQSKRITVPMDGEGRIRIPEEYRRVIGAKMGDEFLLVLQENHSILLRMVQNGSCFLCRTQTGLVHTLYGDICQQCVKEIIESVAQQTAPTHMRLK